MYFVLSCLMKSQKKTVILLSLILVLGASSISISKRFLEKNLRKSSDIYLIPPKDIVHFHFGYKEFLADSLWLRVVQNLDLCEQKTISSDFRIDTNRVVTTKMDSDKTSVEKNSPDKSKSSHGMKDNVDAVLGKELKPSRCRLGWVYHMLDRITDLSPKFDIAFISGATFLSIVVDDREGARRLFDKGVKQFPNDWTMAYRAAYHYLYEMQEPRRAAYLLDQAGKKGAPAWVHSLSAKLYSVSGRSELGISVLEGAIRTGKKGFGQDRIVQRLLSLYDALNAERKKQGLPLVGPPPDIQPYIEETLKLIEDSKKKNKARERAEN